MGSPEIGTSEIDTDDDNIVRVDWVMESAWEHVLRSVFDYIIFIYIITGAEQWLLK